MSADRIPNRREIIDRKAIADLLIGIVGNPQEVRRGATLLLKQALINGRAEIARRLEE